MLFRASVAKNEVSADYPWWIEAGYSEIPPETEPCDECSGTGIITESVTLGEALVAIRIHDMPRHSNVAVPEIQKRRME